MKDYTAPRTLAVELQPRKALLEASIKIGQSTTSDLFTDQEADPADALTRGRDYWSDDTWE